VDESYTRTPGKIEWLRDLVANIVSRDEKVIVWSSFNKNMRFIRDYLSEYGCRLIYGDMSIEERYNSLDNFKRNPNVRVLIATPGAAKEGLTLTVANNVIFYDRVFSLDDYLQSQDRIHRISQDKECNVYNLVMPGSIDEWVDQLIVAKTLAAKFAQGDIVAEDFRDRMKFDFREGLREVLGIDE
jgi:SNF2 family DNA or RNA helicase